MKHFQEAENNSMVILYEYLYGEGPTKNRAKNFVGHASRVS